MTSSLPSGKKIPICFLFLQAVFGTIHVAPIFNTSVGPHGPKLIPHRDTMLLKLLSDHCGAASTLQASYKACLLSSPVEVVVEVGSCSAQLRGPGSSASALPEPFPTVSSWGDPATTCPRGHTGTPLLPPKAQHRHDCPTMSPCDLRLAAKPRRPPHQGLGPPTTLAPFERTGQPSTHPTESYRFGSQNRWLGWQAPHDMNHFFPAKS